MWNILAKKTCVEKHENLRCATFRLEFDFFSKLFTESLSLMKKQVSVVQGVGVGNCLFILILKSLFQIE